jgi:hypothetical protein
MQDWSSRKDVMCALTAALVDVDLARTPSTTAFSLFCSVCFTSLTLKVRITHKNAWRYRECFYYRRRKRLSSPRISCSCCYCCLTFSTRVNSWFLACQVKRAYKK